MLEQHEVPLSDEIDRLAPKKRRGNPERLVQRALIDWMRLAIPGCVVAASVNEAPAASANPYSRARFHQARKAAGVQKGWPDLTVALPGGRTVYVEVKAAKGRISDAQHEIHARLRGLGHLVVVARSIDDAAAAFRAAGVIA